MSSSPPTTGPLFARLVYHWENEQGKTQRIDRDLLAPVVFLGSGANCDLRLNVDGVADRHCLISCQSEGLLFWDLRTELGVELNGARQQFGTLRNGDVLGIGPYELHVETNFWPGLPPEPLTIEPVQIELEGSDTNFLPSGTGSDTIVQTDRDAMAQKSNEIKARSLLADGLITQFQAEWLRDGRFDPFTFADGHITYVIDQIIGAGGMGWICRATEQLSAQKPRQVALKILPADAPSDIRARLDLEGRAGRAARHPHIVRTYRQGEIDGVCYLSLELIDGINLDELIRQSGPLQSDEAVAFSCELMRQSASALAYLEQVGIVHRDMKPANFLIDRDGKLRLLDFGLAHAAGTGDDEMSLAWIFGHERLGTPEYMAPEQCADSFSVDHRADLYGLGCTWFFLLTGQPPFVGTSVEDAFRKHQTHRVPTELLPPMPPSVRELLLKLLEKRADRRPQSAVELERTVAPHAAAQDVEFDLDTVLTSRLNHARMRMDVMRERQKDQEFESAAHVQPTHGIVEAVHTDADGKETTSVSLAAPDQPPGTDAALERLIAIWPQLPIAVQQQVAGLVAPFPAGTPS